MAEKKERSFQIRMSSSLWNLVGEIAQESGYSDGRGAHSTVIREMIAASSAKWTHSPYICRSAHHTVFVSKTGELFSRHLQILRLKSPREKLPCSLEMKPEKRQYYHEMYDKVKPSHQDEHAWMVRQWIFNSFAVWNGKREADDLDAFNERPLSSHVDTFGTTYKSADLTVRAVGGRFMTREILAGLRDYVQYKEPDTPIFDRVDIPIDIPTSNLEICVVVDQDLFASMDIEQEEIPNLALEFRNRESARFEGKEVALFPETSIEERYGRSPADEGADEALRRVRRLRQRVAMVLKGKTTEGVRVSDHSDKDAVGAGLYQPQNFLFYLLRWPSPHLGIEACVRWEKPVR